MKLGMQLVGVILAQLVQGPVSDPSLSNITNEKVYNDYLFINSLILTTE